MRILVLHYKCASVSASKFEKLESWCLVIASRLPRCTMQLQKRTSSWFLNPPAEFLLATEQEGTCASLEIGRMPADGHWCHKYGLQRRTMPPFGELDKGSAGDHFTQPADMLSAAGASFEERGDTFLLLASCLLFTAAAKMKRGRVAGW